MKIRADVAELLRAGHSDQGIAYRLGCHVNTVGNARRALRIPEPLELTRLYAEAHPTGAVFGHRPWTPQEQAQHCAELLAALADDAA